MCCQHFRLEHRSTTTITTTTPSRGRRAPCRPVWPGSRREAWSVPTTRPAPARPPNKLLRQPRGNVRRLVSGENSLCLGENFKKKNKKTGNFFLNVFSSKWTVFWSRAYDNWSVNTYCLIRIAGNNSSQIPWRRQRRPQPPRPYRQQPADPVGGPPRHHRPHRGGRQAAHKIVTRQRLWTRQGGVGNSNANIY